MQDDFAEIAGQYEELDLPATPVRHWVETPHVRKAIGRLDGGAAIDLACSDGYFTRMLAEAGATRVEGVDISPAMIALARKLSPPHFTYHVSNAADVVPRPEFDFVLSSYASCFSRTRDELFQMFAVFAGLLRPGGRLAALIDPQYFPDEPPSAFVKYGKSKVPSGPLVDGVRNDIVLYLDDGEEIVFFDHWWSEATIRAALGAAGFTDIVFQSPWATAEGRAAMGEDWWKSYDAAPLSDLITARLK
jgi:SAM-dependent methyltransferase